MNIKFKHRSFDFEAKHMVIAIVTTEDGVIHKLICDVLVYEGGELPGIEEREGGDWLRKRLVGLKRVARKKLRADAAALLSGE